MKISVLQQDLLPVLHSVARSVGVHANLPVLDNFLLSVDGKKLKVAGTNLEIGIIKYLPVEVLEEGEITVPAKTLVELMSGLGQVKVELESKGEMLTVTSGKFKASLNGIAASEFPVIPVSAEDGVSFTKEILLSSSQILFAAAVDEGRPILTGILTYATGQTLDFVATDGFRLAHRKVSLPGKINEFKSLIPRRTFEEVLRVIGEEDADEVVVSSAKNQNQAIFTIGKSVISSRLIEGQFPSWEKIIPAQFVTRAMVDKDSLLKGVKLAAVFARSEANVIVIKTTKNQLILKSSAKELGSQENEIEGNIEGEDLEIAFNTKFLLDALSASPATQLSIEFSGALSPTVVKPIGVEGLEYIVMPVRLN